MRLSLSRNVLLNIRRAFSASNKPLSKNFHFKYSRKSKKPKLLFEMEKKLREEDSTKKEGYYLERFNKNNETLIKYYKLQRIVPEEEWDLFEKALREDLPSSFRVQSCLPEKEILIRYMEEKFFKELRNSEDDEVHAPEPIPFVDNAFQTNMSRHAVRSHPVLKNLHEFLINENTIGAISRQEAVSMVPPLLLDIQPHHIVLDACAAPGSKTMQIIELMHKNSAHPEGLVIANDLDYNRCYLLCHQTLKRMPTANCVVVNADSSLFPTVRGSDGKPIFFDRILCDVICSGDGTLRKNPDLWRTWDTAKGQNLHKMQQQIASRCFELLDVGGLMVYSTCSLNPIEDEAVVANLLRKFSDSIELVDTTEALPGLKRMPGLTKWKVVDKKLNEFNSYDDVPSNLRGAFVPSFFPPNEEEAEKFHLDRSFRILPHSQNSGGFYVALIRKTAPIENFDPYAEPKKKPGKKQRRGRREDPFVFLEENQEDIQNDSETHYGVDRTKFPFSNLLIRTHNTEKKKVVYYVNDKLRDFLHSNGDRFKVVNAGVGILRRVDKVSVSKFRLMQDGLEMLLPYLTKRIIGLNEDDLASILMGNADTHYMPLNLLKNGSSWNEIGCGSVVLRLKMPTFEFNVCGWIGEKSVSAFVTREEKIHILHMLGRDPAKLKVKQLNVHQEKKMKKLEMGDEIGEGNAEESLADPVDENEESEMKKMKIEEASLNL